MEKKKIVEYSISLQNVVQWKYRVGENRNTQVNHKCLKMITNYST